MAKIYKMTDRLRMEIGQDPDKVVIFLATLSAPNKAQLAALATKDGVVGVMNASMKSIRMCVKQIEGLVYADGSKFELEFEPGGEILTEKCLSELLNCGMNEALMVGCGALMNGIPEKLMGDDGKEIPNVKIELAPQEAPKNQ